MVTSSFLPGRGGIESYLAELCEELAPHLVAFAANTREGRRLPSDLPYPTIGYPGTTLVPNRRLGHSIEREAGRLSVDRVLFGTPWPLVLLGPRLRAVGLSYSAIVHGAELLVPSSIPAVSTRLAKALSEAELLFAVSDFTRAKTRTFLEKSGVRLPPIDLLRARVDLERFNPERAYPNLKRRFGLRDEQPLVLCFGRLVPRKGVDRLIRIADRLTEVVPGTAVVVAGTGPQEKKLRRLAARSRARIAFTGRVSEEEAPALFACADVFALPAIERWSGLDVEGLGVVLLEAAAAGTPCVTGRCGGTEEAVVHGETGYVVDARDDDSLVDRITSLLEDPGQASRMGFAGRAFVAEHFSNRPLPRSLLAWLDLESSQERGVGRGSSQEEDRWN